MKSKFPAISFWLMCIIAAAFLFDKLYYMITFVKRYGGMEAIQNMLSPMETENVVWFYGNHFGLPILFGILFIVFAVQMGRKARLSWRVFAFAFVAVLAEALLFVLSYSMREISVPLFQLFVRLLFLTLLFLLALDASKDVNDNVIHITSVCMGIAALICLFTYFKGMKQMIFLMTQEAETVAGIEGLYMYVECLALPVFRPLAFVLAIAYYWLYEELFSEKEKEKLGFFE